MAKIYNNNFESGTHLATLAEFANIGGANHIVLGSSYSPSPAAAGSNRYGAATQGDAVRWTGNTSLTDQGARYDTRVVSGSCEAITLRTAADSSCYAFFYEWNGTGLRANIQKRNASGQVAIQTAAGYDVAYTTTTQILHFEATAIGQVLELRLWVDSASRPSTPTLTWTDAGGYSSGGVGLRNVGGTGSAYAVVDNLVIADNATGLDFYDTAGSPPSLTSPTITGVTATGATPGISTDTATGTLYLILSTTNTAPSVAQVKAGQNAAGAAVPSSNQAISSTGAKTSAISGLSAATTYYVFWVHTSGGGLDSAVTAGTSFTTSAAAATAVTLSGPSSGSVGVASSAFTVGANGSITGTVTVTPSDGGGGGTFTPTSVAISAGTPTATFTYTPASAGAKSISVTNNGGLTNPSAITYTVSSVPGLVSSPLKNNAGTLHLSAPFEAFVLNVTTGALVLRKTGLTSNGSTGVVNFTDAALTTSTQYRVVWRRTDTGAQGVELLTAS